MVIPAVTALAIRHFKHDTPEGELEPKHPAVKFVLAAWNDGDFGDAGEHVAPDIAIHVNGFTFDPDADADGPTTAKQSIEYWRTIAPDINMQLLQEVGDKDHIAIEWLGRGTHTGERTELAASGNAIELRVPDAREGQGRRCVHSLRRAGARGPDGGCRGAGLVAGSQPCLASGSFRPPPTSVVIDVTTSVTRRSRRYATCQAVSQAPHSTQWQSPPMPGLTFRRTLSTVGSVSETYSHCPRWRAVAGSYGSRGRRPLGGLTAVPDGLLVVVLDAHRLELAVGGAAVRDREHMVGVARLPAADDARRVVPHLAVTHVAPGRSRQPPASGPAPLQRPARQASGAR
jgi:SnoaL-like polyketide cyclase